MEQVVAQITPLLNNSLVKQYLDFVEPFHYIPNVTTLSQWQYPIGASFTYLFLVFSLRVIMKNRQPFKIEPIVALHNLFMTFISLLMFVGMTVHLIASYLKYQDIEVLLCDNLQNTFANRGGLFFWVYIFYLTKYYELLDTIFLCLRKKPLNFLHVYHHWITLILIWTCLQTEIPVQWIAEVLNSFVHIPMYYYYFVSYFGIHPWWKKYLTQLQIIQFIVVLAVHWSTPYLHFVKGRYCRAITEWGNIFGESVVISYLFLFIGFYIKTYREAKDRKGRPTHTKKE
eukprot:TRINITY_DN1903_c0_g1_i1.p1 TRINITY_DN1903_c0_g1~~TRINITY_DN1903_c0_g1_i1.p1  ORF type:complete len:285 (-),score=40.78 TRINITY_DN1903_c0_g1_i1:157-1011(-)